MSTTVSAAIQLQVTKDGDTLGGVLLSKGFLNQQKDTNSGTLSPDYTNPDDQPVIYPRVTSALQGGAIAGIEKFTNVQWYFNSADVTDNPAFQKTEEGEEGSKVPALKIIDNPTDTVGSYEIRFEADVDNGVTKSHVTLNTKYSLSESSTAAYTVIIGTKNGGTVNRKQSEILTPYVRLGANEVAEGIFLKYYKLVNGKYVAFGSNATSRKNITVTHNDVNGIDLFKVDVHKDNADGPIICSDVQEVIDDSDPYQIVVAVNRFYPGSPQQTITPKVYYNNTDVTVSESWTINQIKLIFSDGTEMKSSTSGSISLTFDEVKDDAGTPYLYITAIKG